MNNHDLADLYIHSLVPMYHVYKHVLSNFIWPNYRNFARWLWKHRLNLHSKYPWPEYSNVPFQQTTHVTQFAPNTAFTSYLAQPDFSNLFIHSYFIIGIQSCTLPQHHNYTLILWLTMCFDIFIFGNVFNPKLFKSLKSYCTHTNQSVILF